MRNAVAEKAIPSRIRYEHLPKEVQKEIDTLAGMRNARRAIAIAGGATGVGAATVAFGGSADPAMAANVAPFTFLLLSAGGATGFAQASGPVGKQVNRVGRAIARHGLVSKEFEEKFRNDNLETDIGKIRNTYPLAYVHGKNVFLVPDTWIQRRLLTLVDKKRTSIRPD